MEEKTNCVKFNLKEDIYSLEHILKCFKDRKIRIKHLIKKFEKVEFKKDFISYLNRILDNFNNTIKNIVKLTNNMEHYINDYDNYYTYKKDLLVNRGDYPVIWLYHGGYLGGRGVIIKHNIYREETYPIILEDFKTLKIIKNKRDLNRNDVFPAIERFKKLSFNQKQDNHFECFNDRLMEDLEERIKTLDNRIVKIKELLPKIERDPYRKNNLEKDLKIYEKNKKDCLEQINKLNKE